MANPPISVINELLGNRRYHNLVDKILLKRLLSELHKQRKDYAEVRPKILKEKFSLEEEVDCVKDGFRAGRLRLAIPESNFEMTSFYRIAFSNEKSSEIDRDYEISNFLQEKGIKTPSVVYKAGGFTATEFIQGESFLKVLRDEEDDKTNKRIAKVQEEMLDQIAKYHVLPIEWHKIKDVLDNGQLKKYSFEKFTRALGNTQKKVGTETVAERWKESIDDYLTATGTGILHNDLHNENIIVHYNHPSIIDWGDATIGPVHYDVCRLLLTSGFFNQTREEETSKQKIEAIFNDHFAAAAPSLDEKLSSERGVEWTSERFYHAFNRAHASIRLRLVGSTYKFIQELNKNNALDRLLTPEEKELLENLPSYHFTWCLKALEKEGLHNIVKDLESLATGTGMHRKPECGAAKEEAFEDERLKDCSMEEFIQKYNPDVNSWAMMQKIQDKQGLVEKEKTTQEKDIKSLARKRKLKFSSLIATGAAVLIGGALGLYSKYVQPEQERIREEVEIVSHLAENWPQDFSDKIMITYESHPKHNYQTEHSIKIVPAVANFLYVPSADCRDRVEAEFKQFNETHPNIPVSFDVKACLTDGESISLCYPHQLSSDKELSRKKKELKESRTSCLDDHTTLLWEFQWEKGGLIPFDYYNGKSLPETIESLEYIYFHLPGLIRAIETVSGDEFNELLDKTAKESNYAGDDARVKAHSLTSSFAQKIKPSGNIAGAYVGVFCSTEAVLLHAQNSTEKMFAYSDLPCAKDARNAYFTFIRMNGLDLETSIELKQRVEDEYRLILSIKQDYPAVKNDVKVDSNEVEETLLRITKLGYDVLGDTLQLKLAVLDSISEPLEKHIDDLRQGKEVNSACDSLSVINAEGEMLNCEYFWGLARDKLTRTERSIYNLYGIGLREANGQRESAQMKNTMSCNFRATELLSSLEIRGLYNDNYLMGLVVSDSGGLGAQDQIKFTEELLGEDITKAQIEKDMLKIGVQCAEWLQNLHQECYQSGELSRETYDQFLKANHTMTQSYKNYTELVSSLVPSGVNTSLDILLPSFPAPEEKK